MPLRGFTLAEVLITLGIIGIVAALTIPTLMQKYHKQVVETRVKEAVSMLTNARKMVNVDYGLNYTRERFTPNDPDAAFDMVQKYYAPYIKFLEIKKLSKGVLGILSNGSSIYFYKSVENPNDHEWNNVHIYFCIESDICEELDTKDEPNIGNLNGKKVFRFADGGESPSVWMGSKTREQKINGCSSGYADYCTALISENSWVIPDDYPLSF